MADDYFTLVQLEIEEPEILPREAQRMGFTDYPGTVQVTSGDSTPTRHFTPGLISVELPTRSASLYQQGGAGSSSARLSLSMEAFPALRLLKLNVRLQRIRARVWWWRVGYPLDQAVLVWRGQVEGPSLDIGRQVFSCTLAAATRETDAPFPPGTVGDEDRFPLAPDQARPNALPVIYGTVRGLQLSRVTEDLHPLAANCKLLVAGHRVKGQSVVVIYSEDGSRIGGGATTYPVQYDTDGLGNAYSHLLISSAAVGWDKNQTLWLQSVDGYVGPDGRLVEKLGDVLVHLMQTYSRERFIELDRERIFASRALLNRFTVSTVFNAPGGSVLRALKSRFEPQFPIVFNYARGLFGWDYAGIPPGREPMGSIVWRHNAHERSALEPVPTSELRSRVEVAYGLDMSQGGTTQTVRRDENNSARCRGSYRRWGISAVEKISAQDVADEQVAALLAEDLVNRLTKRRLRITYVVDEPRWVSLPLFGRLAVTDSDIGWADEICLIESIQPRRPGRVAIGLVTEAGI